MPISRSEGRRKLELVKSCLGQSLMRLQTNAERSRHEETRLKELHEKWQRKWSRHGERIAHQLETIETRLDALTENHDDTRGRFSCGRTSVKGPAGSPRLTVVGLPSDVDEAMLVGAP